MVRGNGYFRLQANSRSINDKAVGRFEGASLMYRPAWPHISDDLHTIQWLTTVRNQTWAYKTGLNTYLYNLRPNTKSLDSFQQPNRTRMPLNSKMRTQWKTNCEWRGNVSVKECVFSER